MISLRLLSKIQMHPGAILWTFPLFREQCASSPTGTNRTPMLQLCMGRPGRLCPTSSLVFVPYPSFPTPLLTAPSPCSCHCPSRSPRPWRRFGGHSTSVWKSVQSVTSFPLIMYRFILLILPRSPFDGLIKWHTISFPFLKFWWWYFIVTKKHSPGCAFPFFTIGSAV